MIPDAAVRDAVVSLGAAAFFRPAVAFCGRGAGRQAFYAKDVAPERQASREAFRAESAS